MLVMVITNSTKFLKRVSWPSMDKLKYVCVEGTKLIKKK